MHTSARACENNTVNNNSPQRPLSHTNPRKPHRDHTLHTLLCQDIWLPVVKQMVDLKSQYEDLTGVSLNPGKNKKKNTKKQLSLGRDFGRRRQKKLSINQAFEEEERQRSLASVRRAREREKKVNAGGGSEATKKIIREVTIPEVITVQELANRMATRSSEVIKSLMYNWKTICSVLASYTAPTLLLTADIFSSGASEKKLIVPALPIYCCAFTIKQSNKKNILVIKRTICLPIYN